MLGRTDIGSLEAGKAADLFMLNPRQLDMAGALQDPANLIARTGLTGPVHLTMAQGRVIYRDGKLSGVQEEQLAAEAEQVCSKIIRQQSSVYKTG